MTKRRSGVPEPLPEREEVERLQAVAEWIVEADQGTAPYWVGSEVEELHCKHYRMLPDERIARDGHRLRVRVRTDTAAVRTESAVEVVEEQDTGHHWVWPTFDPYALAIPKTGGRRRRPRGTPPVRAQTVEDEGLAIQARALNRFEAELIISHLTNGIAVALPLADAEAFVDRIKNLPTLLDLLNFW